MDKYESIGVSDKNKIEKILGQHQIAMFRTKVVEVTSERSLEKAMKVSVANRKARTQGKHGERHIILVKAGTYRMGPSFWPSVQFSSIVGDLSGPKPIFLVDNYNPTFTGKNAFINFHFKLTNGYIALCLIEDARLSSSLDSISLCKVTSLTIFDRTYSGYSLELKSICPPPLPFPCST